MRICTQGQFDNRAMHLIPLTPLLGVCSANQLVAANWRECHGLLDQPLKQPTARAGSALVEPEREFVQIVIQVGCRYGPLMCPQQPPLEQRGHAVGPGQQVCTDDCAVPHHLVPILLDLECRVAIPTIGQHLAARTHGGGHGVRQHRGRRIRHPRQPNATDLAPRPPARQSAPKPCPPPRVRVCQAARHRCKPRPPPPCRKADPGPVAPARAAICATNSKRCGSSPTPAPAGRPRRWPRFSGSPRTTWLATTSAAATGCRRRASPQSP